MTGFFDIFPTMPKHFVFCTPGFPKVIEMVKLTGGRLPKWYRHCTDITPTVFKKGSCFADQLFNIHVSKVCILLVF